MGLSAGSYKSPYEDPRPLGLQEMLTVDQVFHVAFRVYGLGSGF